MHASHPLTLNDLAAIYTIGAMLSVLLNSGIVYMFAEESFQGFSDAAKNALIVLGMFVWPLLTLIYAGVIVWLAGAILWYGSLHLAGGFAELWRMLFPSPVKLPKARVVK